MHIAICTVFDLVSEITKKQHHSPKFVMHGF